MVMLIILLLVSIVAFLLSFAMIINTGGPAGLYTKISSQILAQIYSSMLLLSLFASTSSLILLFITRWSARELFLIDIKKPLIGYATYVTIVALYFYDQIFNQSGVINVLLTPIGIELSGGSLGLWKDSDLFTTRLIQTLITGFLIYYGFFAAFLFSRPNLLIEAITIVFITILILLVLFVLNKLLGIKLHNLLPGTIIHLSMLFSIPFILSIIKIKINEKDISLSSIKN